MKSLMLILLLTATIAHAETYKWTDSEGTVHFTESLGEIPAKYRVSAKPLAMEQLQSSGANGGGQNEPGKPSILSGREEAITPTPDDLKTRMMTDDGIMAIIGSLQNDPQMQDILSDPAVMKAVQSGDTGVLMNNPAFLKLLDNPKIREIGRRMSTSGSGTK
jgi:hypothetical protein